jgi:hypothetical protein
MKPIVVFEMKRAFANRRFFIALSLGLAITLSHVILWVVPNALSWEEPWVQWGIDKGAYPYSLYETWMGGQMFALQEALYFIVLPLLICIPFAMTLFSDRSTGYIRQIVTRVDQKKYFAAKTLSVFLSAGTVAVIPLLANFMLTALFFSPVIPEVTAGTFPIDATRMWVELFYSHPLTYVLLYMGLIFIFSGLLACLALFFTYVVSNGIVVALSPFILYMLAEFGLATLPNQMLKFSPASFLRPDQPIAATPSAILAEIVLLGAFLGIFLAHKAKRDEAL